MKILLNGKWGRGRVAKMAKYPFIQTFQENAPCLKLFRDMLLFWNSIFRKSSYSGIKLKKKKKNCGTRVP